MSDFEFAYCPECGSTDLEWPWIVAGDGKIRRCKTCGSTWHVILESVEPIEDDNEPT